MNSDKWQRYIVIGVCIFFLLLYSVVSLGRHFNFRSTAFDLGIYNQALYQYAHFNFGSNTLRHVPNLLGDHFEPIIIILSPLYWIFGSYALLIVQVAAIIFGGYGIYRLTQATTRDRYLSLGSMIIFFLSFGVLPAVSFDYHNNVVGIMFLPWALLSLQEKKIWRYYFFLILLLLAKENLALVGIFLGLSVIVFKKELRRHGVVTLLISLLYFSLVMRFVIPWFNDGRPYTHWFYENLGENPLQAISAIILHPIETLALLFNAPEKFNVWLIFLISGGILSLFYMPYALLFLPMLAQKFFTSYQNSWGLNYHYNIELALIMAMSLSMTLARARLRWRYGVLLFFVINNIAIFYVFSSYQGNFYGLTLASTDSKRRVAIHAALELLPDNAAVSATGNLVPHLASRDKIYLFPEIRDSNYILLDEQGSIFPYRNKSIYLHDIDAIARSPNIAMLYAENGVYLLRVTGDGADFSVLSTDNEENIHEEWWDPEKYARSVGLGD